MEAFFVFIMTKVILLYGATPLFLFIISLNKNEQIIHRSEP